MANPFIEEEILSEFTLNVRWSPEFLTDVVAVRAKLEYRDQKRTEDLSKFRIGFPRRSMDQIYSLVSLYKNVAGRAVGFRMKVPFDYKSCPPLQTPAFTDADLGAADGITTVYKLQKQYPYGSIASPVTKRIFKPRPGTVTVGVGGVLVADSEYTVDTVAGKITFTSAPGPILWTANTAKVANDLVSPTVANGFQFRAQNSGTTEPGSPPVEPTWPTTIGATVVDNDITWEAQAAQRVTSGFEFCYAVRFDTDRPAIETDSEQGEGKGAQWLDIPISEDPIEDT